MIERRIGLEYKQSEEFTIAALRGLLNVPAGKLERFADFNKYCLKVAQEEINKLCPFWVEFTPIKKGRKVERVSMMWLPKTMSCRRAAPNLLDQHSIVRRATLPDDIPDMPVLVDFSAPDPQRRPPPQKLTLRAPGPPRPSPPSPLPAPRPR